MFATLLTAALLPAGSVTLFAGGPAADAKLRTPFGVAFDPAGNAFVVELEGQRVVRIDRDGRLTTVAGTGTKGKGGDGGPPLKAEFDGLHTLVAGRDGTLYLADTWNWRARRIPPTGDVIATVAGTGRKEFGGDGGPATAAGCSGVYCVALNPSETALYLADLENRRVRKVDFATGTIATVAGNGQKGVPKDGDPAASSPLVDPRAVAVAADGTVYVLERGGHALRAVDPAGKIRTVAGTGKPGPSDAGGDALKATLRGPKHLTIDRDGTVLICDTDNHCVRRYDPKAGTLTRVIGTGEKGATGVGGPPDKVQLNQPHGVTVGPDGALYIADSYNHRVLKVVP